MLVYPILNYSPEAFNCAINIILGLLFKISVLLIWYSNGLTSVQVNLKWIKKNTPLIIVVILIQTVTSNYSLIIIITSPVVISISSGISMHTVMFNAYILSNI